MKEIVINLVDYGTKRNRIYVGLDFGKQVAKMCKLKQHLQAEDTKIKVVAPAKTLSVELSFLMGLLGNSIWDLGYDKVFNSVEFVSDNPNYDIEQDVIKCFERFKR